MRKGLGLVLDGQTLAHLEVHRFNCFHLAWLIVMKVLVNGDGSEEGTLLSLIGRCVTPFGEYPWKYYGIDD